MPVGVNVCLYVPSDEMATSSWCTPPLALSQMGLAPAPSDLNEDNLSNFFDK